MELSQLDKNFEVSTQIDRTGLCFFDVEQAPFSLYGVKQVNGFFRRMPEEVAKAVSEGVYGLHTNTAGGRVRFVTDSPRIAIHAVMSGIHHSPHFALAGKAGFDVYLNGVYRKTFMPPVDAKNGYESVIDTHLTQKAEVLIHFPLYANVKKLFIGLEEGAAIEASVGYDQELPVVFYGSSITQGGCASRPGNAYQNILSRLLNVDHVNLGFSGNARAEEPMVEHVAGLSMCAFVLDYDHNAPTPEFLRNTHEKMFKRVRAAHPTLPILLLSRPKYYLNDEDIERLAIVRETYERALAAGDQNVYFIPGTELMEDMRNEGLVDNCHPNDAGFVSMARRILPALGQMLGK